MLDASEYETAAAVAAELVELLETDCDNAYQFVLQRILDTLHSPLGFCGYIDATDGALVCASMTGGVFDACQVNGKSTRFPREQWGGLWGQVLLERRSLFRNGDHRVPSGHLALQRSLGAPILSGDELVGSVHVANRDRDYSARDARLLELILQPVAPLLRSRLRRHQEQLRAEESRHQLEQAHSAERRAKDDSLRSLQELQRLQQAILDGTPSVAYVKDLAGRYRFVNSRYEQLFHVRRETFLGQTDFDLFPAEVAQQFQHNDRHVAETGQPLLIREMAQHDDGLHFYLTEKFPLRTVDGRVDAVAGISTDISRQVQMEQQVQSLSRQRDLILDAIGDGVFGVDCSGCTTFVNPMAVQLLGWCETELLGQPMQKFIGVAVTPLNNPPAETPADIVFEDEHSLFQTKSGTLLEVRFVSRPLIVDQQQIGAVITFRSLAAEQVQRKRERAQAEAEQRHFEQEFQLRAIRSLQLELFPGGDPQFPAIEIAGRNFPRQIVSGDFFDYVQQPDGSLIIVVGDATGHDLSSAVHMVEAHAVLHTLLDCGVPLQEMLVRLNHTLCRHLSGRFVTLFVLRLDPQSGLIEFAGAGHDATLVRASGQAESLPSTGLVLGLAREGLQPTFASTRLDPGDVVVLLTDGFQEARAPSGDQFGRKRILDAVAAARSGSVPDLIDHLKSAVDRHIAPLAQQDDMTAVVIRRSAVPCA